MNTSMKPQTPRPLFRRCIPLLLWLAALLPASGAVTDSLTRVKFETTMGNFVIALYNDTPLHRDNFLKLVREGYYDGLLFHRVIRHFMVQAGDPDSRSASPGQLLGEGGPGYTLPAEIRYPAHYHRRGAVAAAREGDDVNPEWRSSGSQFYVVWGQRFTDGQLAALAGDVYELTQGKVELDPSLDPVYRATGGAPHLDGQYTVFGEVVEGLDVIEAMQAVETNADDRPITDVRIVRATVAE